MNLFRPFFKKLRASNVLQWFLFAALGLLAFYKTFSFWFFHGWETSWLLGITAGNFSLLNLMKSHGLISYMNLLLFGWRPAGWFVTALIFHVITAMIVNIFVSRKTNRSIGLAAGLLFLVTTAHHDVVTWGSFESLYAVQTLSFYLGLWFFDLYMQSRRLKWYGFMVVFFLLSMIIRESGLIFLPLVFIFDLIFHEKILEKNISLWKKSIVPVVRRHVLLWVLGIAYVVFRSTYGGAGHDFIDERVQFRILLFHEYRFLDYIRYGFLAFGYFIGPYVIPYPILNITRDVVVHFSQSMFIQTYFFTWVGWITYSIFCYVVYRSRKSKFSRYLWFALISLTAVTLFYSFAWTTKESFLASPYSWSENRWRYLGFTFFASGLSIVSYSYFFQVRRKARAILGVVLLGIYLGFNTLLLHRIEDEMYRNNSLPAVMFYKTFIKTFPTLTADDTFFEYRASPGLNDYMLELSYIYPSYYPNVKKFVEPWVRSDMYYILKGFLSHADWTNHMHFIDYTVDRGVRDYTQKVHEFISSLKPVEITNLTASDSAILADIPMTYPVEFRYFHTVNYRAFVSGAYEETGHPDAMQSLAAFSSSLSSMMRDVKVSGCLTTGDSKEPFYDLRKKLAFDGNISARSYWWANCRPAFLVFDMGREVTFSGAVWASTSLADSIPRDYQYDISHDGKKWEQVYRVRANTEDSKIDEFPQAKTGRYIRFLIDETSYGQMVRLDEFVPLFPETVGVATSYKDAQELYKDMYSQTSWMKVIWNTTPDNTVAEKDRTLYVPIIADGLPREVRFVLPESDFYSALGQFLTRKLTSLKFEVPRGVTIMIDSVQIGPVGTVHEDNDGNLLSQ